MELCSIQRHSTADGLGHHGCALAGNQRQQVASYMAVRRGDCRGQITPAGAMLCGDTAVATLAKGHVHRLKLQIMCHQQCLQGAAAATASVAGVLWQGQQLVSAVWDRNCLRIRGCCSPGLLPGRDTAVSRNIMAGKATNTLVPHPHAS